MTSKRDELARAEVRSPLLRQLLLAVSRRPILRILARTRAREEKPTRRRQRRPQFANAELQCDSCGMSLKEALMNHSYHTCARRIS